MGLLRQILVLTKKNLLLTGVRSWPTTLLRAIVLPIAYMFFIAYVRNFFLPPSNYGVGSIPRPVRNLTTEVFGSSTSLGGRTRVAFINNGFRGGQIEQLINAMSSRLNEAGADVYILSSEQDLYEVCPSSLRGTSGCYAAASFHASPSEGPGGLWNYTATADFGLGLSVFVNEPDNDAQIFVLPFIHAIDTEIAAQAGVTFPETILEYPFTYETIQDRQDEIQNFYMRALVNYLAVTLFIGMCGITYHLPGFIAVERELGISQLIDAMFLSDYQWTALTGRLVSTYIAFSAIYLIGWISMGTIVSLLVFYQTANSIVILFHLLAGFALTSWAILGGTLFRRAQLSGITVLITSLVLAVLAQFVPRSTATLIGLSLIFPSVTYTTFMIQLAGWERRFQPANLGESPPGVDHHVPGYLFFVFLFIQAMIYPFIAAVLQWRLYGITVHSRKETDTSGNLAFRLINISKDFGPGFYKRILRGGKKIRAVENLNIDARKGELLVLLGANGSGKSTTLKCLTGVESINGGRIDLDSSQGMGFCPQNNVLWDDLTVTEHVQLFYDLKRKGTITLKEQIQLLLADCDLANKANAMSKTLSGGQKRKLQLAMAFAGNSAICCIDEVSSGLDPLSRKSIWNILLAERSRRTLIITTHALDEADALADEIVIMSKGRLVSRGSAVELKNIHGGGYRVTAPTEQLLKSPPPKVASERNGVECTYELQNSSEACQFIDLLQRQGIGGIHVNGPTVEDVFLNLTREYEEELSHLDNKQPSAICSPEAKLKSGSELFVQSNSPREEVHSGQSTTVSFIGQILILMRKRVLILSRNYLPYCCALVIPIVTAGLTTMFLGGFNRLICSLGALANNPRRITLAALEFYWGLEVPVGPTNRFAEGALPDAYTAFLPYLRFQDTYSDFQNYIVDNFRTVVPGGFYLTDPVDTAPVMAYRVNGNPGYSALAKNVLDSYLLNTTIVADFTTFALPFAGGTGDSLQLVLYFGFAMCAYPAFFALYPTFERLGKIRSLHYCNGVRPISLWLAYLLFDLGFILIVSVVTIVLLTSLSDVWFAPGYLFVVFLLFGISSTLLTYIVSLFAKTQLAAFAFSAGGQAVFLLVYFIMYMVFITFASQDQLLHNLNVVEFTYGLITPSGNLLRALLLSLNQSQLLCRNQSFISYPGDITVYGGPILYLTLQSAIFFAYLVWHDSGHAQLREVLKLGKGSSFDVEKEVSSTMREPDVTKEVTATEQSQAELRVLHLTKCFSANTAVDDVTFSISKGNIFALLGPNGAGKSTTIDLIRGDIHPSNRNGDVFIDQHSIRHYTPAARRLLGVCPQFDTMDRLTVEEHLSFYARIRGVTNINFNVDKVMNAVGLSAYKKRMTAQLSGGNQRKLSLGTSIMGNPTVLLLDEPSSGMDAVSRRIMWKVIEEIKHRRSVLITTHSMEEATRLADKAGIMARRLLAIGTTKELTKQHGQNRYRIHLALKDGADSQNVYDWIVSNIEGTVMDGQNLHGQMRFSVPTTGTESSANKELVYLLRMLEDHKISLGIEYYSVNPTTLEDVFLDIARKAKVEEGN